MSACLISANSLELSAYLGIVIYVIHPTPHLPEHWRQCVRCALIRMQINQPTVAARLSTERSGNQAIFLLLW